MAKDKPHYVQLDLFSNMPDNTSNNEAASTNLQKTNRKRLPALEFPITSQRDRYLSPFALLHLALCQIIDYIELHSKEGPRYANILKQHFLEEKKDSEIALSLNLTGERIRQIRTQAVQQLMSGQSFMHVHLNPQLIENLKNLYPQLIAQNPHNHLHSGKNRLPFSLLEFIDLCTFKEKTMADQHFIIPSEQAGTFRTYVAELVKLLRSSYVPMEMETVLSSMPALLKEQHITFNEEWFRKIIAGHQWIETVDSKLQLCYEGLRSPSLKIARIIYENKRIHKNDIIQIYNQRASCEEEKIQDNQMALSILIKRKDARFQCQGKSGIWTFNEQTPTIKPIMQVLHDYLAEHTEPIHIEEVWKYTRTLGYDYSLHTVRCYLLKECVSSMDDSNLLCRLDRLPQYPHIRWRNKLSVSRRSRKKPVYYHQIIDKIKELLENAENHCLPKKEITAACKPMLPKEITKNTIYKIINQELGHCIQQKQTGETVYLLLSQ